MLVKKVSPAKKSSYERSQDDICEGRVEKFNSADEMIESFSPYYRIGPTRYSGPARNNANDQVHTGNYAGSLKPDWLLIWNQNDTELTLLFTGTGTHSELFGKKKR